MRTLVDRMYGSQNPINKTSSPSHNKLQEKEPLQSRRSFSPLFTDVISELMPSWASSDPNIDNTTTLNNERAITQLLENRKRYLQVVEFYKPPKPKKAKKKSEKLKIVGVELEEEKEETKTNDLASAVLLNTHNVDVDVKEPVVSSSVSTAQNNILSIDSSKRWKRN